MVFRLGKSLSLDLSSIDFGHFGWKAKKEVKIVEGVRNATNSISMITKNLKCKLFLLLALMYRKKKKSCFLIQHGSTKDFRGSQKARREEKTSGIETEEIVWWTKKSLEENKEGKEQEVRWWLIKKGKELRGKRRRDDWNKWIGLGEMRLK